MIQHESGLPSAETSIESSRNASPHSAGPWHRLYVAAVALTLAAALPLVSSVHADTSATPAQPVAATIATADDMYRAVKARDLSLLSTLNFATSTPESAKLEQWKNTYVQQVQATDKQRADQYDKAVSKAQEAAGKEDWELCIAEVVRAHDIARDKDLFLTLDWVTQITNKVATKAAEYEKAGRWIESLQLYTDINSLFEISTKYKADMQRLARRTRLLAMYVPKELYEQRKEIIQRERKANPPATQAATTQNATTTAAEGDLADETPAFTRWQDQVEGCTPDMLHEAIADARNNWVEQTSYETLLRGGVESLRLFLTTPELAKEFPALADPIAKSAFEKTLNDSLAKISPDEPLTQSQLDQIVEDIYTANNSTIKLPSEVVTMEFTDGAMEKLDPFSAVIWPHEIDEFNKNTRGNFSGVGIQISMEHGRLEVISPLEDSPAYTAGIQAGDTITGIDGKSTVGISIDQAVHQITGTPDTQVVLRIKREGMPEFDKSLTRATIKVKSVKGYFHQKTDDTKWDFIIDPDSKIGYVRVTGFQEDTAQELQAAIDQMQTQGMRGIVIDLRFNPGGLLTTAVKMCKMFLDKGTIVSTRGRVVRPDRRFADETPTIPVNTPMIVLVNQYSASASEIFSGAMKDLGRALIVGERSFGKGSVQNLMDLREKALMKLTVAYYYLPNNESLHRRDGSKTWGVEPDVKVELTPEQVGDLLKTRRDSEIIHRKGEPLPAATTQSATQKSTEPVYDTQLETALLLMRLQLIQQKS